MADGIFIAEEAPGQRLVNDHDFRRFGPVLLCKRSSGAQLHAHGLKVVRTDMIGCKNRLFFFKRYTPFDLKEQAYVRSAAERKKTSQTRGLDARQGFDTCERFLEISDALRRSPRVFGEAGSERKRQYTVGIETLRNGQQE